MKNTTNVSYSLNSSPLYIEGHSSVYQVSSQISLLSGKLQKLEENQNNVINYFESKIKELSLVLKQQALVKNELIH